MQYISSYALAMLSVQKSLVLPLLSAAMMVACGSDFAETIQGGSATDSVIVQQGLLDTDWTLETVRSSDGEYRPLPLGATWRLSFEVDGRVSGNALCNGGSGDWQADDATLNIVGWFETEIFCESIERIPIVTQETVARLFRSETVMPRIEAGRLILDTGGTAQLVFSGRLKRPNERSVTVETLVRSGGFSRASNGNPVLGDLASPYVVYRDAESLNADYAALRPAEIASWPALPIIDFTSSTVIGAYLPLNGSVSSDVVVRGARVAESGLEIEVARFGPNVPDEESVSCPAGAALTAPWTLARIDSVVEPVSFVEMARAYCSGIPARN